MKKFKYLLAVMLLGCSTMSFAQFMNGGGSSSSSAGDVEAWKGLRLSYDRTFVNLDWDDDWGEEPDMDMNGFSIGYVQAFKIAKKFPIFFETGLGLNFARRSESKSYSEDVYGYTIGAETKTSTTALGLTIPLNFVYGVKINDALALKPYTGFYLRVNVMSKDKYKFEVSLPQEFIDYGIDPADYNEDETYNNFDEKEVGKDGVWNRCQFGWQIGATLDINSFNVGIGYALDFNEIEEKTKTSKFAVTVGYNF